MPEKEILERYVNDFAMTNHARIVAEDRVRVLEAELEALKTEKESN